MKRISIYALMGLLLLTGCGNFFSKQGTGGGTGGNTTAGDVLYFMNVNASGSGGSITGYSVSTTGVLSAITNSPYSLSVVPTAMAITPSNTYLYVASAVGILGYSIGTNGVLTALNAGNALVTPTGPLSMQVDSTGAYLLVAGIDITTNIGAPQVYEYTIDSTGGLTAPATGFPFDISPGNGSTSTTPANTPTQLYLAPNNSFMYLTLSAGGTEMLGFDASSGSVSDLQLHINLTSTGAAQTSVLANATSTVLYVSETGSGVRAFPIGTTGAVGTELTGSPFKAGTGPSAMSLDGSGDFLYVTNKGDASISGFSISSSGLLTALGTGAAGTGTLPISLTLDQSKAFLAVANSGGNPNLGTYSFDATTAGKLDPVTNSVTTTATGTNLVLSTH